MRARQDRERIDVDWPDLMSELAPLRRRWDLPVLASLAGWPRRPTDLIEAINGQAPGGRRISWKVLNDTLRRLEASGHVGPSAGARRSAGDVVLAVPAGAEAHLRADGARRLVSRPVAGQGNADKPAIDLGWISDVPAMDLDFGYRGSESALPWQCVPRRLRSYRPARPGGPKPSSGSGTTPIAPSGRCLSSRTWLPLQVQAEPVRAQAPLRRGNTRRAASGRPRD